MSNIPVKPKEATWTNEQWQAIWERGKDILVAAAAGSGKTAVLVERIIQKILSQENPVNVDELLVVTFTNASAQEMRHRIGEALMDALNKNPKSDHLRTQFTLLNRASISTLHSFCLEVIRKYYYLLDLDPGFRMSDEIELQLLMDEVLDELFEEEYGKENNEAFFNVVDAFSTDRSDKEVQNIILAIYRFAVSHPFPNEYLQRMKEMYDVKETTRLEDLPFYGALLSDIQLQLEGAKEMFTKAFELTKVPGGPDKRAETFLEDLQQVDQLLKVKDSWIDLYKSMENLSFSRLPSCKGDEYDEDLLELSKNLRDKGKEIVLSIKEELFSRKPENFLKDMKEMSPLIGKLVDLVVAFSKRFTQVKREKGIVDFSDLEHLCLQILLKEKDGEKLIPSEAALHYREKFVEIFVDEYQDTNMVQETILQLIKRKTSDSGNLFMVGDVKQSIYRFRLAEPYLFLRKYKVFGEGDPSGIRIDLTKNFRSRKEILDGTNFIFKQIMGTTVGEIDYDPSAELVFQGKYPQEENYPVEMLLMEGQGKEEDEGGRTGEELETPQLEAKVMARKIKELINARKPIYNPKTKESHPIMYRDIVILLRSMTWAPTIMEEFKEEGIPVYADLSTGYFEATEISVMLSLLKLIDNPYQDIPLAAVLRSPIVGLTEEELATIRIYSRKGSFYESFVSFVKNGHTENSLLYEKARKFYGDLLRWRKMARQTPLAKLIWQLYQDTLYYDYVGGLPGGKQRQANLKALYDKGRQFEETSFRGLFRFLRFIERMQDRGDDFGTARALGEQEDVVRIMTIHSSKGLEFPVVFVAGLNRNFNMKDLHQSYLLDKDWGFASKYVNIEKRITYPSLPQMAFKKKKRLEMLSEEMRILYVALTRAKEKLYLLGTVHDLDKQLLDWAQKNPTDWLFSNYDRISAKSYLDWIGPALIRHKDGEKNDKIYGLQIRSPEDVRNHPAQFQFTLIEGKDLLGEEEDKSREEHDLFEKITRRELVPIESAYKEVIQARFGWKYPYASSTKLTSKQSVSEIKRHMELFDEQSGMDIIPFSKPIFHRPQFMQKKKLTPQEKGSAMHMVMQQVNLTEEITVSSIENQLREMVKNEFLTEEQGAAVHIEQIVAFFESELGRRMVHAKKLQRELPFSAAIPVKTVYPDWYGEDEKILVQGVIDCLFEDEQGLVLVDYKTDTITGRFKNGFPEAKPILIERYRMQIYLYTLALEQILKRSISEKYLYFFDGSHIIDFPS